MSQTNISVNSTLGPTIEVLSDGGIVINVATPVSGTGDVTSSSSSVDNQIVRFDGTSGKIIQNSGITIADGATGTLSGTNTGNVTIGTANGLSIAGQALSLATSSASTTGALTSTDWSTFNSKQPAGNYITALTGDVTASGPGSAAATLTATAVTPGAYTLANITVDSKGRITSAANGSAGSGTVTSVGITGTNGIQVDSGSPVTTSGDIQLGVDAATMKTTLNLAGTNTGDQNLFGTFAVAGQSSVVADSTSDTLTLVAGSNITITTNASTDSITINSTASGSGDVVGPASSTDNAIARYDQTTGKLIQNSGITIPDGATGTLSGTNTGDQTNITGNAATVTTNANLTGPVTSIGNATSIANGAISNAMLANGAVANLSGTNTGDQTIVLTGDVTGSGTGTFAATIANNSVTYSKIQDVSGASKLLGRGDSGSGDPQEITLGTGLSMSGTTLNATGGGIGDMTKAVYDPRGLNIITGLPGSDNGSQNGGIGGQLIFPGGNAGPNAGEDGGNAGAITIQGGNGESGLAGGSGGNINTSADGQRRGGNINTSASGFLRGGDINTAGGGDIETSGTGSIGFGASGTRTTVTGTATADRAISLPNAGGTLALTSDITGTNSGTNTGDQNLFGTIAVAGQSNVVADSTSDTLTLVAGTNITITTNDSTDSITINSTASGSGDVVGPASATDNALVRYDGTTGKLIQNGQVTQSDTGDLAAINSMTMDTTPTGSLAAQGQMMWNADEETLDIQLNGFALHVGEHIVYHVKNSTGSTIAKGVPVMFAGTTGNSGKLLIQPWNGTGPTTQFMGLTAESLTTGSEGFVIAFGKLRGIQTNGGNYGQTWVDGEIIYTGTTTGSLTKTQPAAPNSKIQVLAVVHAHASNGTFFIRPSFGSNIKDDEGVTITSLSTGQVLVANSAGTVFENKSVSGDATLANTGALTLATVNSNTGAFGSVTAAPAVTVNAKGLVTAVSTNTITPAVGSITGLGTGVATALAINVGSAGAPVVNGGALGTPSSGTLTNCTGLPIAGITGTLPVASGGTGQTTAVAAFDALAPTTTKGDLIVHDGTDNIRVAVGATNGHVLTVDSAEASGIKWAAASGGGAVVAVRSAIKTDTQSLSSTTFTDITGLSITYTPTSASNKILVVAAVQAGVVVATNNAQFRLVRDSTAIGIGDAAGSRTRVSATIYPSSDFQTVTAAMMVLDSPASTSSITYKVQFRANASPGTAYINRPNTDTDNAFTGRCTSTITIYEVTP